MSRAHPGMSNDYQKKKDTRNQRERDRALLREAQNRYRLLHGNIETTLMNRTKLKNLREEIKLEWYKE